ncbi:MAG: phage portal protein [Deltaproteobacteria bacterium]|nr:phage portal protein [Deltaproteobacteria bacterium]
MPGLLTTTWQDGRELIRPGHYQSQIEANKHWVYVCAQKNAAAVASSKMRLYAARSDKERTLVKTSPVELEVKDFLASNPGLKDWIRKGLDIEEVEEHPFLNLMKNVNSFIGRFTLLETTELFLELTGNAYWYVISNALGLPAEIWLIPSQHTSIVGSKDHFISGYTYRLASEEVTLSPEEVVHFKFPNPANMRYGRSPLMAVVDTYNIFENMQTFENALFSNMARPEGVLTTDQTLGKAEIETLREMWSERYGGVKKAGKIAVLAAGLKYQNITMSPRELSFLAGRKMGREEICAAFGVPLSKVTAENVNLANAKVGEEQYQRDTIRPRLWRIEEKINESLMPRYAPNIFVAFDDPVPADREFELKKIQAGLTTNFLTINEVRKREGLPSVSWGDKPWKDD